MAGQRKLFLSDELYRGISGLIKAGRLSTGSVGVADDPEQPVTDHRMISCVLHEDITSPLQKVACTRLVPIQDQGSRRAWQATCLPENSGNFSLTVDGATIGPFKSDTTAAQCQTALDTLSEPPRGWVLHGNFFLFPAVTVTLDSGEDNAELRQCDWLPLAGDAFSLQAGCRTSVNGTLLRGSVQVAEWVHGFGYAIRVFPAERLTVAIIGSLAAATNSLTGATTGNAAVLRKNSTGNYVVTRRRVQFKNFNKDLTASSGTLAKLEWIHGAWEPYWVGCKSVPELSNIPLTPLAEGP